MMFKHRCSGVFVAPSLLFTFEQLKADRLHSSHTINENIASTDQTLDRFERSRGLLRHYFNGTWTRLEQEWLTDVLQLLNQRELNLRRLVVVLNEFFLEWKGHRQVNW